MWFTKVVATYNGASACESMQLSLKSPQTATVKTVNTGTQQSQYAKYIIWMDSHFDIYYVLTLKIKAVQFDLYLM